MSALRSVGGPSESAAPSDSVASLVHALPDAPETTGRQSQKYNSTASIYIDSTISKPCVDEIIFCLSIVLHDRIEEGENEVTRPLMATRFRSLLTIGC